jgi:hypothetical protein
VERLAGGVRASAVPLVLVLDDVHGAGCTVEAFMVANHIDPDLAAELFVLDRPVPGQERPERYAP